MSTQPSHKKLWFFFGALFIVLVLVLVYKQGLLLSGSFPPPSVAFVVTTDVAAPTKIEGYAADHDLKILGAVQTQCIYNQSNYSNSESCNLGSAVVAKVWPEWGPVVMFVTEDNLFTQMQVKAHETGITVSMPTYKFTRQYDEGLMVIMAPEASKTDSYIGEVEFNVINNMGEPIPTFTESAPTTPEWKIEDATISPEELQDFYQ